MELWSDVTPERCTGGLYDISKDHVHGGYQAFWTTGKANGALGLTHDEKK